MRQLLWHRHNMVQMRTRVMNQLQVVALNEGVRRKKTLWGPRGRIQLESLSLLRGRVDDGKICHCRYTVSGPSKPRLRAGASRATSLLA